MLNRRPLVSTSLSRNAAAAIAATAAALLPLTALASASEPAKTADPIVTVALDVLAKSVECPVPPTVVSNEDDGRFKIVDKIIKTFSGDATSMSVTGTNHRHFFDGNEGQSEVVERKFEYKAKFADLADVTLNGNDVVLSCAGAEPCIVHSLKAPECNFTMVETSNCRGPADTVFNILPTATLTLCSPQATVRFKIGFDAILARARRSEDAAAEAPKRQVDVSALIARYRKSHDATAPQARP